MIYTFNSPQRVISIARQGAKFYHLYLIHKLNGITVPDAVCVTDGHSDYQSLKSWLDPKKKYAVRSSANFEDLHGLSSAGIFESYLNVQGTDEIVDTIKKCQAQLESPKAIAYLKQNGLNVADLKMQVIVQEMVSAQKSGVMFTVNPISGRKEITVQFVAGAGDKLVEGLQVPQTIVIKPEDTPTSFFAVELVSAARLIENQFGMAQDIEWAWLHNKLYILQARPLDMEHRTYDPAEIWTRANIGEIVPRPLTPLSEDIFQDVLFGSYRLRYYSIIDWLLTNIIHLVPQRQPRVRAPKKFWGYYYLNLATIYKSFGNEPWVSGAVLEKGLGFEVPPRTRLHKPDLSERIYRAIKKLILFIESRFASLAMEKRVPGFIHNYLERHGAALADSPEQLLPLIRFLFGWHIAVTARGFSRLGYIEHRIQKRKFTGLTLNDLVHRISDMQAAHTRQIDRETFDSLFSHRASNEFELEEPDWGEQPELLDQLFKSSQKQFPEMNLQPIPEGREQDLLEQLEEAITLRENLKSLLVLYYRKLRKYYLNTGFRLVEQGKLTEAEDIFFLNREEIKWLQKGKTSKQSTIAHRKARHQDALKGSIPSFFIGSGSDAAIINPLHEGETYAGIGCSAGIAKAQVCRLTDPGKRDTQAKGKILVTKFANPAWTPQLLESKGIICEVGGLLSHLATIARENKIPMIVGIDRATELLTDGQIITMDGLSGKIQIDASA